MAKRAKKQPPEPPEDQPPEEQMDDLPEEGNSMGDMEVIEYSISKFFTLEEAAGMLPEVRKAMDAMRDELSVAKDEVILKRRMLALRKEAGAKLSEEELAGLREKYDALDDVATKWLDSFLDKGIIVRDLERGLIDFPYQPTDPEHAEEIFFLCWEYGEDGLFYFHAPEEGFAGRRPISVLPD